MPQDESVPYLIFPYADGGVGLVKADSALKVVEFQPSDLQESDRKFGGWMTVEVRDRQGDVVVPEGITVEEYIKVMGGPLLDMHRNKPIGRLTKMELRPKKLKDGAEKMGVYVEGYIFKGGQNGYRDYPNWKSAWDEIRSSFRDSNPIGLSLGGDPEGTYIRCKEGSCERVVKVTYLEEVSLVRRASRPANPESFLDKHNDLAKSDSSAPAAALKHVKRVSSPALQSESHSVEDSGYTEYHDGKGARMTATTGSDVSAMKQLELLVKSVGALVKGFHHEYKCGGCGSTSTVDGRLKEELNCSTCSKPIDRKSSRVGIIFRKQDGTLLKSSSDDMHDKKVPNDGDVTLEGDFKVKRISAAKAMAKAITKVLFNYDAQRGDHPMFRPTPHDEEMIHNVEDEDVQATRSDVLDGPEITGAKPQNKQMWRARGERFGAIPPTSPRDFTNAHRRIIGALRQRLGPGGESFYNAHFAPQSPGQGPTFSGSQVSQRLAAANPQGYNPDGRGLEHQLVLRDLQRLSAGNLMPQNLGREQVDPTLAGMVPQGPRRLDMNYILNHPNTLKQLREGHPLSDPAQRQALVEYMHGMFGQGGMPPGALWEEMDHMEDYYGKHPRFPEFKDFRTAMMQVPAVADPAQAGPLGAPEQTGESRPIHFPNAQRGLLAAARGMIHGRGMSEGYTDRDYVPSQANLEAEGAGIPWHQMADAFHGAMGYAQQMQQQREQEARHRAAMAVVTNGRVGGGLPTGAKPGRGSHVIDSSGFFRPHSPARPAPPASPGSEKRPPAPVTEEQMNRDAWEEKQAQKPGTPQHNKLKDSEAPEGVISNASHQHWRDVLSGNKPFPAGDAKFPGQVYDPESDAYSPVPVDEFAQPPRGQTDDPDGPVEDPGYLKPVNDEAGKVPARTLPYGAPSQRLAIIMREAMRHGVNPHDMELPPGAQLDEHSQVAPMEDDDASAGQGLEVSTDREAQQIHVPRSPKAPDMKEQLLRRAQMEQQTAATANKWQPSTAQAPPTYTAARRLAERIGAKRDQLLGSTAADPKTNPQISGFLRRGEHSAMATMRRATRNIPTQVPPTPQQQREAARQKLKSGGFTQNPGALPSNAVLSPAVKKPAVPDVPKEQDQVHKAPSRPSPNVPPKGAPKSEPRKVAERASKILIGRPKKPEGKPVDTSSDGNRK